MERETKTSRGDVALRQGKQKEAPWTSSCSFRWTAGEELGRLDTDGMQARGDEAEEAGFAAGDGAMEGGANGRSSGSWLGPSIHWIDRWLGLAAERSVGGGTSWLGRWDWIWEDPDEDAGESDGGG